MSRDKTVADAVSFLSNVLTEAGIEDATREARLIVSEVFGIARARLSLAMHDPFDEADMQCLLDAASARLERQPLSHVLGKRAFYNHEFRITPDVLDPRPETETLVSAALSLPFDRVLDLGVGSGAILLSLLDCRPKAKGIGTDLSEAALAIARVNAKRLGLEMRAGFLVSDWYVDLPRGTFDLIVSNPPYIALDEMAGLAPELFFEPRMALTDEGDGLSAYRVIVPGAGAPLRPGGWLMVEIGWQQGAAVQAMFADAGFADIAVLPDLDGRDRVVQGRWPG